MNEPTSLNLKAGDLVQVRALDEILATLDDNGCLENMPFMPEMAQYCGRRLRVFRRAHKTCDTIEGIGGRTVNGGGIHLVDARCDGAAHGGCHNACMLFWKDAWLKRADEAEVALPGRASASAAAVAAVAAASARMPVRWLYRAGPDVPPEQVRWRCQATEAFEFTTELSPFRLSQYVEDLTSRNIDVKELLAGMVHAAYRKFQSLGVGYRVIVGLHDWVQKRRGGIPNPYINGKLKKTPLAVLDLQVGEMVRIKPFEQIMATLDTNNKNRGLWFVPPEMGRFCGREARVVKRVERLINERTGEMMPMKTPAVVLDDIWCTGRTVENRMFCPRAAALYWREIWLERVEPRTRPAEPVPAYDIIA